MQQAAVKAKRTFPWWGRRGAPPEPDAKQRFLQHLPLVQKAAASAARRGGCAPQDIEDFVAAVQLKLIDNDYAVIRRHRGQSSLSTYLVTVVHRAFQDWRHQKWGRFRPSSAAKRLGPVAVHLETLWIRDGMDLDAAVTSTLMGPFRGEVTEDVLREMASQLPQRSRPTEVSDEALEEQAAEDTASADQRLHDRDRKATAEKVYRNLKRAMVELEPKEQLILQMFYADGCKGSVIARTLGMEQRELYTHKDRGIRHLRRAFDAEGLTWDSVRDILGWVEAPDSALFSQGEASPKPISKEDTP